MIQKFAQSRITTANAISAGTETFVEKKKEWIVNKNTKYTID